MIEYDVTYSSESNKKPVKKSFKASDDEHMRIRVIADMRKQKSTKAVVTRSYVDNLGLEWTDDWEKITYMHGMFWVKSLYFDKEPFYIADPKTGKLTSTKPVKKTR